MSGRASDPAEQMVRPTPPMRLMIVDDHEIVRQGLIATLGVDREYDRARGGIHGDGRP